MPERILKIAPGGTTAAMGAPKASPEAIADRSGFEPEERVTPFTGLANRRLQPLGHLSSDVVNDATISRARQP